ncbi:MAG: ThiF family adenylyltransferase [Candidatus Nanoarchaeia archaeon]|nr:ThiF family adenylyltransferase [Candidatus Nanoarchaeia archaeon]
MTETNFIYSEDERTYRAWGYDESLAIKKYDSIQKIKDEKKKNEIISEFEGQELNLGRARQKRLYDSKVLVVGSSCLSQIISSCVAGIGIGNIYLMDNKRFSERDRNDFLCLKNYKQIGKEKVGLIANELKKINTHARITPRFSKFNKAFASELNPQIIIDATNDCYSKETCLDYAVKNKIPMISASADDYRGTYGIYWPMSGNKNLDYILNLEFNNLTQIGFTSGVIGGLVADEIRKYNFQQARSDKNLRSNERFIYNLYSTKNRQGLQEDLEKYFLISWSEKRVLVAGAGALGNSVALSLVLLGIGKIDILDFDTIESTNVPRQILLRGEIGGKKAEIVSKRIKEINPRIKSNFIYGKVGEYSVLNERFRNKYSEDFFIPNEEQLKKGIGLVTEDRLLKEKYDLIFGCFDNKYARMWLNDFTVKNNIPYIDTGVGTHQGQVAIFVPDKTKSINDQLVLENFPDLVRNSCMNQGQAATIIPNMVIGNLAVGESTHILNSGGYVSDPILGYDSFSSGKIYFKGKH